MNFKQKLLSTLKEKKLTIATAESLTGGLLSSAFVDLSGASSVLRGGVITYMVDTKNSILSIPFDVLKEDAVNIETAQLMAKNVALQFNSDFGLSTTGIAEEYDGKKACAHFSIYSSVTDTNYDFFTDLSKMDLDRNEVRNVIVIKVMKELIKILDN